MLAVEKGCLRGGDEELAAVGVGAGVLLRVVVSKNDFTRRQKILSMVGLDRGKKKKEKAYSHGEQTGLVVLEGKVFVLKRLVPPDARRPAAVAVEKVAALAHEVGNLPSHTTTIESAWGPVLPGRPSGRATYNAVKLGALVALGTTDRVLALARAELAKVFRRLGDDVLEQLKRDSSQGFSYKHTHTHIVNTPSNSEYGSRHM